jgi:phosphatidylethanolamine/phosphatidyl-N-methylethanolamine N-methyltransferase
LGIAWGVFIMLLFLRKFLRSGQVAAVTPSSRPLAETLCREIDPRVPQTIVELGAGTGAVTRVACQRMHPKSRMIAVEIDRQFAEITAARCPRAEVVVGDVSNLDQWLSERGIGDIDVMISCLALPTLPRPTNAAVFDCLARRGRRAAFTQLTLVPLLYRRMYVRLFQEVRFSLEFRNLPPGGAYYCRGLRDDYAAHVPGKSTHR